MDSKSVIVIGGGLAGLSSAVALAEAGYRIRLFELRPHLGGRATSYWLPDGSHVDNCQHVTLGCCTNLEDFYRRVGAAEKIRFYKRLFFVDQKGRRGVIEPSTLLPPGHLAPSFLLFSSLTWADKNSIARVMTLIVRTGGSPGDLDGLSMLDWLRRHGQTDGAISRFWQVVLVSALNEELERTDARFGVDVFWKGFLANRRGFEVGIPSVPLAELYDGCRDAIVRRGGEVRTRAGIREILVEAGQVKSVRLDDGTEVRGDYFVSAVPHNVLPTLLSSQSVDADPQLRNLRNLGSSPITGIHFWYDRQVMNEPFLTLLDRTTQWIFNKTLLYGGQAAKEPPETDGQYLQLVISASYGLVQRSRQEIIDLCRRELMDVLPATREAQLLKATVIKETQATFSPSPGCDRWRPPAECSIRKLYLAGDWTATGWPATMEGAVRSGYLAAEAILAADGLPARLLQPDLPVEGLSRLWAAK